MNSSTSSHWTFAQILEAIRQSNDEVLSTEQVSLVVKTIKELNFANSEPYPWEQAMEIIQICTGIKPPPTQNTPPGASANFFPLLEQIAQTDSQRIVQSIAQQGEELQMAITESWTNQLIGKVKQMLYKTTIEQMAARIRGKVLLMEQTGKTDGTKFLGQLQVELSQDLNRLNLKN